MQFISITAKILVLNWHLFDMLYGSCFGFESNTKGHYLKNIFCIPSHFVHVSFYFIRIRDRLSFGPRREKHLSSGCENNKGADQPVHLRSLISAFLFAKCYGL